MARVVMAGSGPTFRFLGSHGGTASPKTVQPGVWLRERTPTADGLEIVGEHEEAVGIEASGTMQLTLTRLNIRRALHAVHLVGRNRNVITGLHVNGVHTHPAGMMIRGGSRLNVAQCTVLDCQHAGMAIEELARSRITGCMIRNDVEDAGPWTALAVKGGEENHLSDNTLGPDR